MKIYQTFEHSYGDIKMAERNPNLIDPKAMSRVQSTRGTYKPLISEVLTKVNNAKDKPKKMEVLRKYDSPYIRQILKAAFDPKIKFVLPEGTPPFIRNEAPAGTEHTSLFYASKKLWRFVKGADPETNQLAREKMFLGLLESLHEKDADVLIGIKDKKLNNMYKGLTSQMVRESFNWDSNFMKQTGKSILKELLS